MMGHDSKTSTRMSVDPTSTQPGQGHRQKGHQGVKSEGHTPPPVLSPTIMGQQGQMLGLPVSPGMGLYHAGIGF